MTRIQEAVIMMSMPMSYIRMSFLAVTALLAAGPLSAQTRIGAIGEAGANGAAGVSINSNLSGPSAPALAPSLSPAALNASLLAPSAPAFVPAAQAVAAAPALLKIQPVAVTPALPKNEAVRATLEALAPEKLGKISGESAKALSGRLLGLEEGRGEASEAVEGRFAASTPDLDPSVHSEVEPAHEPRPFTRHERAAFCRIGMIAQHRE